MHPPSLHIRLLGPLEVGLGDEVRDLPRSRKARALLAYLAASDQAHSRSALCDLFWQDGNDPRAGLRWALSKIRASLEPCEGAFVDASRDQVRLVLDGAGTDVRDLERALVGGPEAATTEALRWALAECHGYQAWCLGMRERYRNLRLATLAALVGRLREDPAAALPHALARLALDPVSEDAYVVAMEVLGDLGRVPQALELYDQCRRMLATQLGRAPSSQLELVRHRLTAGPRGNAPPAGPPSPDHASPGSPFDAAFDEPPFVGRPGERASILARIEGLSDADAVRVVLVTGEPGIGKTRMLREAVRQVQSMGGWALFGQAHEGEEVRPYGPWIQALGTVPASALSGGLREELAGLVPGPCPERGASNGPSARAELFGGVVRLLTRLAQRAAPGLVVLDDVQWLDDASVALLHYVARSVGPAPVLIVCAAREGEESEARVGAVLRALARAGGLHRIPLERLDAQETSLLVSDVSEAVDPERVFRASEGNPLFALEIARCLSEGMDVIPATLEEELDARLERAGRQALSVASWAAAVGRAFELPLLVQAMGRPAHEVVDAVESLERLGIVRAAGVDQYEFSHSLLRRAAHRRTSEPVRRVMHHAIALALDAVQGAGKRQPGAIAHHALLGGEPALAARASTEAAEESVWLFAFDEAAQLAERGLAAVQALADEARLPLEMDLLHVYARLSMRHLRPPDLEDRVRRVIEGARAAGMTEVVAKGHFDLAALQYQRGAYDEIRHNSARCAAAARVSAPREAVQTLCEAASCLLLLDRDLDRARAFMDEANALADANAVQTVELWFGNALLHHHDGALLQAIEAYGHAIDLGRRVRDRWWECPARTRRILVDLQQGDVQGAQRRAAEAEQLAALMGDPSEAAFARGLGAVAAAAASEGGAQGSALAAVDDALAELRTLDDLWMVGELQGHAAELDLRGGRVEGARWRATEVWEVARTLARPSLLALARGLLARGATEASAPEDAAKHLGASEVTHPPHQLSFRAREALRRARSAAQANALTIGGA
jgi:DNA-binding SARP family transcriptional activator/tetratricopeptide (TPR) repeat protein